MEAQQNGAFSVLDLRNQERRSTNEEGEYFLGQLIHTWFPMRFRTTRECLPFPPVGHSLVAIQYHTLQLHTMTYHTIPYQDIPYHTMTYHTVPESAFSDDRLTICCQMQEAALKTLRGEYGDG